MVIDGLVQRMLMEEKEGLRWWSGSELTPQQRCIVELCRFV